MIVDGVSVHGIGISYKGYQRPEPNKAVLQVRFTRQGKNVAWIDVAAWDKFQAGFLALSSALTIDRNIKGPGVFDVAGLLVTDKFNALANSDALEWLDSKGVVVRVLEVPTSNPGHYGYPNMDVVQLHFTSEADAFQFKLLFNRDTSPATSMVA